MKQEEKAKAYDEALDRAKEFHKSKEGIYVLVAETIFPELRESEDEMIRKELWEYFHELELSSDRDFSPSFTIDDILTWLEKQKAARNESNDEPEDERIRKELIELVNELISEPGRSGITVGKAEKYLAYLEKQKENPKSADSIPSDCVSDAKCEDRWHKTANSLPDNGRDVLAKDALGNYLLASFDGAQWFVSVYDGEDHPVLHTPPILEWCEIPSEKQKEQKPSCWNSPVMTHEMIMDEQKEQKSNIELIQRAWYMEGYHDREFGKEPKWIIKTGEGGPKHELNPRYGQPLTEQRPTEEQLHDLNEVIKYLRMDGFERIADSLHSLYNILQTQEQKPYEPHNWPADKDNLTQEQKPVQNPKKGCPTYPLSVVGDLLAEQKQKPADNVSKEEYVKRFKSLCDAYEIKLPNREYDIYHLCDDLSKLSVDFGKQKPAEHSYSNDNSEYDKGYMDGKAFQLKQTEQYSIGKTFMGLIPCWVNAPSTLQPAHKYHGKNAVIMHENNGGFRCCFIDDDKPVTVHLPENTLFVEGWRKRPAEWSEVELEFRGEKVKVKRPFFRDDNGRGYSTTEQDDDVAWYALRAWCEKKCVSLYDLYPRGEWSDEDERIIDTIVSVLGQYIDYKTVSGTGSEYATPRYNKEIDWLKSFRPTTKK